MRRPLIVILCTVVMSLFLGTSPVRADEGNVSIDQCLERQDVWLLVVDEAGDVMANQCVGRPSTGEHALREGGMAIRKSKGLICSINSHPDPCPRTFDGAYWTYYHGKPGADWTFSDEGARTFAPPGGSVEAWCYTKSATGADKQEACVPPALAIQRNTDQVGQGEPFAFPPTSHEPITTSTPNLMVTLGVVAIVIVVAVVCVVASRRKRGPASTP